MGKGKLEMSLAVLMVLMGMLCMGSEAQSSCTNVLISLSPCLNYITGNSSTPTSGCCSQLSSVVRSQPLCLCQVLNGGGSSLGLGLNFNQTQALALPAACNVKTPPITQCKAASPAGSPSSSPSSGTGSTPTITTTDDGSSSGNSIKLSITLLFIVFAATYASTFATY